MTVHTHSALVLGAGFGGLAAAIRLREAGYRDTVVLEKASAVGGTWRDNTYPGCACDVQSHLYSLSFAPNAGWSRRYAGWREIRDHLERDVVDRFGLRPQLRLGREVVGAEWDEARATWVVRTSGGEVYEAPVFVIASGPLHVPSLPTIPGLDRFRGPVFHSARWDHAVPLDGRVVGSIGTGASAVQYVPAIAPQVRRLHVFQRSAAWVIPRDDRPYADRTRWAFAHLPGLRRAHRAQLYLHNEARGLVLRDARIARAAQRLVAAHLARQVHDPALAARLTPTETLGCKRVLVSSGYYPTFNLPQVELVTDAIREITPSGVVTADGRERALDVLICGTGFVVDPRRYMDRLPIVGRGGQRLLDAWKDGPRAYLGVTVPGFPNLFQLFGPNSGLGHTSVLIMMEAQVEHLLQVLDATRTARARTADVRPEAADRFDHEVQAGLRGTVWASGCDSWYQDDSGRNFTIWPWSTWRFLHATRRLRAEDYRFTA